MLDLSPETEALARTLAEARHMSVDATVRGALEAQSDPLGRTPVPTPNAAAGQDVVRRYRERVLASVPARDMSPDAVAAREAAIKRVVAQMDALPDLDTRSVQEIVDDINEL